MASRVPLGTPTNNTVTETRKLADLLEVSQTLGSTLNLKAAMTRALEILKERHGLLSGSIVLADEETGQLAIEVAAGLSWQATGRVRYRVGEGITGKVVQSGKPVVVPRASHEPLFLDRTGILKGSGKQEISFICVPITVDQATVGALGVTLPYDKDGQYEREVKFFGIAASLVGHALRAHRLLEAERKRLGQENIALRQELKQRYDFRNIVGNSRPMQAVYEQVAQVARTNTTVLIRGESGTGKEMIAHAVHYGSPRAAKPFIKVSCGALPESLIESELFGYEAGAFTDARAQKKGRFELANGGTLFLDEVGELTLATQVKLLRVLQEKEFDRLGGVQPLKVNVRLIAATNKDLEEAVRQGTFREDLYYRLNVFSVYMPPLRERRPDILLLADHFVQKYAADHGKDVRRIATTAIDMMMSYHWPGNVRELENCIERAVLVCEGGVIHAHHLPPTLQTAEVSGTLPRLDLTTSVEGYEKDLILDALKTTRGNRAKAARLLGTTERIIAYKVKKYEIDCARFKSEPRPRAAVADPA
ncbi:MAG: sigma-54-dependent Fis family transcriptional regulator [Acidobacteria bacterium]|nr:MAG: sigma-54-dependent Fis family transcriptional regulator [Acidobacteriota bacterium]